MQQVRITGRYIAIRTMNAGTMKTIRHNDYHDIMVESSQNIQSEVTKLQQELMQERIKKDIDKILKLEHQIDELQRILLASKYY